MRYVSRGLLKEGFLEKMGHRGEARGRSEWQ